MFVEVDTKPWWISASGKCARTTEEDAEPQAQDKRKPIHPHLVLIQQKATTSISCDMI